MYKRLYGIWFLSIGIGMILAFFMGTVAYIIAGLLILFGIFLLMIC